MEKVTGIFQKDTYFAKEFQSSYALSFAVVTVTEKPFSKVVLCLNMSENNYSGQTLEVWPNIG